MSKSLFGVVLVLSTATAQAAMIVVTTDSGGM